MGDIADMMIDGGMCESCGEFFEESVGYPRKCKSCRNEDIRIRHRHSVDAARMFCPKCKSMIAVIGISQHYAAKHPDERVPRV